jgi:hypothetical protein
MSRSCGIVSCCTGLFCVDEDAEAIERDRLLDDFRAAVLLRFLLLVVLHRTRRLREIDRAVDECGDAGTAAAAIDLHHRAGMFRHVLLGQTLPEDDHRVGTFDGERLVVGTGLLLAAAARNRESEGERKDNSGHTIHGADCRRRMSRSVGERVNSV